MACHLNSQLGIIFPSTTRHSQTTHPLNWCHPSTLQQKRKRYWPRPSNQEPLHICMYARDNSWPLTFDAHLPQVTFQNFEGSFFNGLHDKLLSLCEEGQLDLALHVLMHINHYDFIPSVHIYRSLLKMCKTRKASRQALHVHVHLAQHGLEIFLGEYLVVILTKCNALVDAIQLFHRLPHRTALSWTALISAYTSDGQGQVALEWYDCMRKEGAQPNNYTFVSLLKACGSMLNLEEGKRLHMELSNYSCEADLYVGACLVDMYANCGDIIQAEIVFGGLSQRDVVSWNAMLMAYVDQGEGEMALQLYKKMQDESVGHNERTFVIALQACCVLAEEEEPIAVEGLCIRPMSLEIGKLLHADSRKKGFHQDVFVGSNLVSMYGKCGSIMEAETLFGELSHRDVVSWNVMLSAYVDQSENEKALHLYRQIQEGGLISNERTFAVCLQACCTLVNDYVEGQFIEDMGIHIGQALHVDAQRMGFDINVFVGSILVSMYGKCGSIMEAENVFEKLSRCNMVSWNSMLSAYCEQGEGEKALRLYRQIYEDGLSPDERTFLSALQACCILAEKEEGIVVEGQLTKIVCLSICQALHVDAQRKGFDADFFIGSALVSVYGKCQSIEHAICVFDRLFHHDIVSWTAMLSAYVEQGQGEQALQLYTRMHEEGVNPNEVTISIAIQACCTLAEREEAVVVKGIPTKVKSLQIGKALHKDAHNNGFDLDVVVGSTLVGMYGKCGKVACAMEVFAKLPCHDIMSCTAMLSAYVEQGQGEKALQLYREMQEEGISLDDISLVCALQACSETASVETCRQIHFAMVSAGHDLSNVLAINLIHAYGSCSSMMDALAVFNALPCPCVDSWTIFIAGYAQQGNFMASLQNFEKMQLAGITPNGVTFFSLLSACNHAGLVNGGVEFFESMRRDHGLTPEIEHFGSMVDLLGRAGDLGSVEEMLLRMSRQPDPNMWLCLLGACQKHGNVELGKRAFDFAMHLQPKQAAAYGLMSNIYADAELHDSANKDRNVNTLRVDWKL